VYAVNIPLSETCITQPVYEKTFTSIPECLAFVDDFRYSLREQKDLFITGFCTKKDGI